MVVWPGNNSCRQKWRQLWAQMAEFSISFNLSDKKVTMIALHHGLKAQEIDIS